MSNVNAKSSGGMSFAGVLTVIFVVLKLVGVINWSWIWVLSPLWISFIIFMVVLIILVLIAMVVDKL